MATYAYEQLIVEGIKDLPPEILSEIADYVYFMRRRAFQPDAFEDERYQALLHLELKELNRAEEIHLMQEFEQYDHSYPRE